MQTAVLSPHIYLDERGVARITGTTTKVIEVAIEKVACGWTAEEMHEQHDYLSLAQIHAALSYYYDHKAEIDAEIEEGLARTDAMAAAAGEDPLVKALREAGRLK